MSLSERLRKIETEILALRATVTTQAGIITQLVELMEDAGEEEGEERPALDLDGNVLHADRGEGVPL